METKDNPGDCQAKAADSTTQMTGETAAQEETSKRTHKPPQQQQQVSSTTTVGSGASTANKPSGGSPPPTANSNSSNKLKSQQQQQQHYQFRAPQQFVKQKRSAAAALAKKNKTWNKRQNKTAKQQHQHQQQQQQQHGGLSNLGGGPAVGGNGNGSLSSGGVGGMLLCSNSLHANTSKADLENIQNLKNQHYYHHHYGGGRGAGNGGNTSAAAGLEGRLSGSNGLPPPALAGLEKLGYGHGHLKQQLYKKMLAHRGHHHHVLCSGAAHNSLGMPGVNSIGCCLLNGCSSVPNGKDSVVPGPCNHHNGGNSANSVNTLHFCCGRSKFFLPDKRPRKEVIIPPTKFLLGGNISDPLNLNSLQNETSNPSANTTPATTPRRSPITTPPKVEVIIPPNIHDPLHLLDPVDSMEYEKQLTSPMKRVLRGPMSAKYHHNKHRHRKHRKRRRFESFNSNATTASSLLDNDELLPPASANSSMSTEASLSSSHDINSSGDISANIAPTGLDLSAHEESNKCEQTVAPLTAEAMAALDSGPHSPEKQYQERERLRSISELRLELNSTTSSTCGSVIGSIGAGGAGGRKRKISESNNSQKNKKFHRHDSMDKIVSPVVPQPGAWKRPPRVVPSGARKPARRSTSVSETELLSPAEEMAKQLEAESPQLETPDLNKLEPISESGAGSPLSTMSNATGGEQELVGDASMGENTSSTATGIPKAEVPTPPSGKLPKFREDGAKYRYGNYDRYAGFRHLNEFMDVRLQVFQRHLELFQQKDILDVGCNVGHMTIAVARNLGPKSILGIDIDKELVSRARQNLGRYVRLPQDQAKAEVKTEPTTPAKATPTTTAGAVKKEPLDTLKKESAKEEISPKKDSHKLISPMKEVKKEPVDPAETAAPLVESTAVKLEEEKKPKKCRRKRGQRHRERLRHEEQMHQHYLLHHHYHHHHAFYGRQLQQQAICAAQDAKAFFPVSFPLSYGGIPAEVPSFASTPLYTTGSTPGHPSHSPAAALKSKNEFPRNVFFRQSNYILKDESQLSNDAQQYDLILCLSVTKWIHLNFGDNGLKLAFKRMFNQLRPGGKLILEAQNWASYKKKKNLTPEIYNNYRNIEFFPNKFHEYLLSSEVGFSHTYTLGVPRHLNKGFCRPIQLYAKGDYTPNHVRWSDAYYPQTPFEAYRGIYATMPPRPPALVPTRSSARSQPYDTPHYTGGGSGSYSCRQTPKHQPTSQYYNPLETDSYLPSYDMEYLNHMYLFSSPLYQTVWSPPASLRNSSSHTPLFGSVREAELDGDGGGGSGGGSYHRHVYPPNDDTSSPNANAGGAFNSIRDPDTDDSNQMPAGSKHVYATNCGESSSSPQVNHHEGEPMDGLLLDEDAVAQSGEFNHET